MSKKLYKRIRVKKPLGISLPAGTERDIEVDSEGNPLEMFWRLRLKDAETDDCVEWVEAKKQPKPKKSSSTPANNPPVEDSDNVD